MTKKDKSNYINRADLVELIASHSDYFLYEVEDVLDSLVSVLTNALIEGKTIRIERLGTFAPKLSRPRKFFNVKKGEFQVSKGRNSMSFKPTSTLVNLLNKE